MHDSIRCQVPQTWGSVTNSVRLRFKKFQTVCCSDSKNPRIFSCCIIQFKAIHRFGDKIQIMRIHCGTFRNPEMFQNVNFLYWKLKWFMIKYALCKNTNIITYCDYFKIFLNNPERQVRIMSSEHQWEFVLSSSQYIRSQTGSLVYSIP